MINSVKELFVTTKEKLVDPIRKYEENLKDTFEEYISKFPSETLF